MILKVYFKNFNCPKLNVTFDEAEMIKYVNNSFLATKISFINEIANLSENFNIDMDHIVKGIGYDDRISPFFQIWFRFWRILFSQRCKCIILIK